ncbi:hypothetical protein HAX54_024711 [Datura stramonium]|uniref:F-box associated beta-propeller type 3 domain-containing protein n=1 Tax=Datura stramonium TaxID=4076 RepID=A0ABS8RGL6_DATST|nr:hypothetical protein [Datura stramonium]
MLNWGTNLRDCSVSSLLNNPISESSEMDHPMRGFHIEWCGSVNGLICLAGSEKNDKSKNNNSFRLTGSQITVCVWNPSIRMVRKLPVISSHVRYSSFRYGFGYDKLHDEYKVVVIISEFSDTKVEVYSLKTDWFWRTVGDIQEASELIRDMITMKTENHVVDNLKSKHMWCI